MVYFLSDSMLEYILLAFLAGILVKIVDYIEDNRRGKNPLKWPAAILYGFLIGHLISLAPFSMVFLAAVVSQVLARKVDTKAHVLAFIVVIFSLLYFGLPELVVLPFVAFLLFSSLDELDHLIFWKKPVWVQEFRPFLELATIPFLFLGQWYFLAGIVAFDVGYISTRFLSGTSKLKKQKK